MIRKTSLLLCLYMIATCHSQLSLTSMADISKYVPAEFLPQIQAAIPAYAGIASSNPGIADGMLATSGASIPTIPTAVAAPVALPYAAPVAAPYSPYAAPAVQNVMPIPTVNSPAAFADVRPPGLISAPTHSHAPAAPAPVVANPFTSTVSQVTSDPTSITLYADRNANPVFHPPFASEVPSYPPIQGQHWYQYVVA